MYGRTENYQQRERFAGEGLDALEPAAEVAEEIGTEFTPHNSPRTSIPGKNSILGNHP
jgi:hypothetical protein